MDSDIASTGSRIWATIADGLLFVPLYYLDRYMNSYEGSQGAVFAYFLLSWQLGWAYSVSLHGWRGRTLGKALVGIRVVQYPTRERLGWSRAVLRELPYIVLVLLSSAVLVYWNAVYLAGRGTGELDASVYRLFDLIFYAGVGWVLLELLSMVVHPERRALHDLLAGSIVVKAGADPTPE